MTEYLSMAVSDVYRSRKAFCRFITANDANLTSHQAGFYVPKEAASLLFDELGVNVDPRTTMSEMPVSQRQMVEIAKAVSYNSKVIVFDEPTSINLHEFCKNLEIVKLSIKCLIKISFLLVIAVKFIFLLYSIKKL